MSTRLSSLQLEPVDPESPEALWCLERYFEELRERFDGGFDPALSLEATPEVFRPPAGTFLLGTLDGRLVACGALKLLDARVAYIKRMWVDGSLRGLGLGRRLLEALESAAAELGCEVVQLETNERLKEAQALYQSAGYVEVPAFNGERYAHHWFRKRLTGD